jgi:endonuclease-3
MAEPTDDPEPAVNISGGASGGGRPTTTDGVPETRAARVVATLGELYWEKTYGGRDAFECLVRTILSQNTSDVASQPAHDALVDRYAPGGPETTASDAGADLATALAGAPVQAVAETISMAGLYNQKARRIVAVAEWICERFDGAAGFDEFVRTEDAATVRETLLERKGVGPKTADCVLLFAGGREGVFPVDTHVHRLYRRLGVAPPEADHETVQAVLERDVPAEWCGFGHTASIQFGREYCSARKPACLDGAEHCPLAAECDQVGVDVTGESVVDPADAAE